MKIKRFMLAVLLSLAFTCSATFAAQPVKIGFVGPLSGKAASLGQDMLDAFNLVVEQNNGKLGGVPVQVIPRDSQLDPQIANQIANQFIKQDKVDIVTGLVFSNITMIMAPKLDAANILSIGANAGPAPLAGAHCLSNVFIVSKQNDQFAQAMGQYAKVQGYEHVIAMAPNYQAGRDFVDGFKRSYGKPLVDEIYTSLNQLDFSAELLQVRAKSPDALFVFYPGALGIRFIKTYRQFGLMGQIPLLSVSTTDGTTLPALGESALGVLHASSYAASLDNPANREFVASFKAKYDRLPSEYAAYSYDAAHLIGSALAKTGGDTSDLAALKEAVAAADFVSVRGDFSFNTNQFPIQDFYVFKVVKGEEQAAVLKPVTKALDDAKDSYYMKCDRG